MPRVITARQRGVASDIASGDFPSKEIPTEKELMLKNGYAETTAISNAKDIIQSEGVRLSLEELGFTEERAKSVVAEIMNNPDESGLVRVNAAREAFKVFGSYAPEKKVILTARVSIKDKRIDEVRKEFEEKTKKLIEQQDVE